MKKVKFLFVMVLSLLLISACNNDSKNAPSKNKSSEASQKKLHIVTTFYPMYEFTKAIVKDRATVDLLIPSTTEPHDWEPTPKDIQNIQDADLFVYNSAYMETWVPSVQESLGNSDVDFVKASSGIDLIKGTEEEEEHEHEHEEDHSHDHAMDPHVWLSPVLAQKEVKNITSHIIKQDPSHEEEYKQNSDEMISSLKELDNKYRSTLDKATKKEIITQHAAFGYLAKEYGLKQVPIAGLSPEEEPSAAKLSELKNFAKEKNVKIIYFEEVASPKVAKTLADEVGAKTEVLNTLEGLSKEEQEKGIGYVEVMEKNLNALKDSLLAK